MKKTPKVSLLLLNWNGIDFTRNCLVSLLKTDYPNFEIVLVDNGSDKEEGEKLNKEFGARLKVVKSPKNLGYAGGMNLAYRYSRGDYIMLLNNDMEFSPGWLRPLVKILENHKEIGACQPKIKDVKNKNFFEYASAAGGYIDIFGYPFARGRIFTDVEKDTGQYDQVAKICWAGIILLKRKVIDQTELFDPIFFNYGEDMDLCMRIYGKGYLIVNVPDSIVYHIGGGTLKKYLSQKMFYHHRNNLIFILKNWPRWLLLLVLFPRFFMDIASFFYYLMGGFREGYTAVIKAYLSLFLMLGEVFKARRRTKAILSTRNLRAAPIYKGSIVWEYFIRRKHKFSDVIADKSFYSFTKI